MKLLALDIKTYFFNGGQVGPSATVFQSLGGVSSLISLFIKLAFVIAGLILLFFIILGGIGVMGNAGKDDPKQMEQAKQTLTSAVIGFVVVIVAYWIVKLIATLLNLPNLI